MIIATLIALVLIAGLIEGERDGWHVVKHSAPRGWTEIEAGFETK